MERKTADRTVNDRKVINKKLNVFIAVMLLVFLVLGARVAYLQIFETERYRTLARENSLRLVSIAAPRGEIYDRSGVKLVGNRPLYNVTLVKLGQSKEELEPLVERLSQLLDRDPDLIWARIDDPSVRRYERIRIAKDIPLETVSRIEEGAINLPGISIEFEPMREYPYDSTLAHVLGYIREIQPKQLEQHTDKGYRMGDQFGQDGLENTLEEYLRGQKGAVQFEVDAFDRPVRSLGVREPVPGNDLHLTIDHKVQDAAERALAASVQAAQTAGMTSRAGSAVAIDVRNGEVLAMASYPAYPPGMFAGDVSAAEVEEVLTSPDRPLINRAVQSSYPPGSTFKMITAIAALESGKITPQYTVHDPGYYWLGRMYTCWTYPRGHGIVNVEKGIQVSCNTFFWTVGKMIGHEQIAKYAAEFGLGSKSGIELNGEAAGVVPTPEYKRTMVQAELDRRYNPQFDAVKKKYTPLIEAAVTDEERGRLTREMKQEQARIQAQYDRYAWELTWRDYDTLNMSIGQGYNAHTPLQLANYVAAIANGGTLYRPHLVRRIIGPNGETVQEYQPEILRRVSVSDENLAIVRNGMSLVTQHGGTGFGAFWDFPIPTAGKTGTAEIAGKDNNGVYVAYAPVDNPEIAIAVIVEQAGQGSTAGAPVAKEMFKAYFNLDVEP